MPTLGVSHVSICVSDLEKSLAFYRDLLGFRIVGEHGADATVPPVSLSCKNKHSGRVRAVEMAYGEGDVRPQIWLEQFLGDPPDGKGIRLDQIGVTHLSFTVPNVEELTKELMSKGVKASSPPEALADASGHYHTVFLLDPDGIMVQFDEFSINDTKMRSMVEELGRRAH